jgi:mRNA interferase RelE/StbE
MADVQIFLLKEAAEDLERLDRIVASRIVRRLRWLAANLESARLEALSGDLAGLYKLRVGDYRVIYEVLANEKALVVHAIGHRRHIYRAP